MPARLVDAVAEQFVSDYCALDPITATEAGIPGYDDRLTDLSPDGFAARHDSVRRALATVEAATPTDEREHRAKEAFVERLSVSAERYEAGLVASEFSVISSGLHAMRECFDLMDTSTEQGWQAVNSRLAMIPQVLQDYRRTLREAADAGHVAARRQFVEVAEQVRQWTGQRSGHDFFARLVAPDAGPRPPEKLQEELGRHARAASEGYADFGRFLVEELAPRAREKDAVGREHYQLASRYYLGASIDLEETYAWGWQELHRIEQEMRQVADQLFPGAGIEEAARALDEDPHRTVAGTDAFRGWMQELADRTIATMHGTHVDIPEPVRRIECRIAPTQDGGIYYTPPSEDFSRPGRMWWSVPAGVTRFSPWREVTTVFHEGVPGHHLQIGQAVFDREKLNRWQRHLCWVSGSGEGWALYAERLMDELGFHADPASRLGMLDAQAFRAARVVVDIGVHLELEIPTDNPFGFHPGEVWNAALAFAFMRQHCRMETEFLRFEVNRYLGWAGQAPSYKVGERLWLEAREDARRRHGAAFDLKAFHSAALALGSVGLDPLMRALERQ